jgi:hypothetical protein
MDTFVIPLSDIAIFCGQTRCAFVERTHLDVVQLQDDDKVALQIF